MAARRDATTAYAQPAESLYRAEPKQPVQVEVKAARPLWFTMGENVGAGLGAFLISHYAVGLDPIAARNIGATLAGALMMMRYALDEPADLIRVWIAERAAASEQDRIDAIAEDRDKWFTTAKNMHGIANEYAQEIEQLRRELSAAILRNKKGAVAATPAPRPVEEQAMTGWKDGDPYEGMRPFEGDFAQDGGKREGAQKGGAGTLLDDENAAYDVLENAKSFGGIITRKSCQENSGIGRRAWDRGVQFLERCGAAKKDEANSYVLTVEVHEAFRLAGNAIDERQKKRTQYGSTFTPA